MVRFDATVVGAGVVGLATARALAASGSKVAVLERHLTPGEEQSTHNSQVVHSGMFARPGTLRARLNVRGNAMLYQSASEWGVPIEASGTLVVAVGRDDLPRLQQYHEWGKANGVPGLRSADPLTVAQLEPHLGPTVGALLAPSGGRVDAQALVVALDRELLRLGVERHFATSFEKASFENSAWHLTSADGGEFETRGVINSAGVASADVAERLGARGYRVYPCLGEYAKVRPPKNDWVRSMVYSFPPPGFPGIGVHLTRTLQGDLLLGPTATYQESAVAPSAAQTTLAEFQREAASLLPGLEVGDLEPGHSGVRAKSAPPGSREAFPDWTIVEDPPGCGVVQLIGIESPGLTACLAIGEHVAEMWAGVASRSGGSRASVS